MIRFLLIALFSLNTFAALSSEDLHKIFLMNSDLGPLSTAKIIELDDAFTELGLSEHIVKLQDKLGNYNLSFLSQIIHGCNLDGDTLGTYQRGKSSITRSTLSPEKDFNDLRVFWDIVDPELFLAENYKVNIVNNGPYVSLVVMEWPVICIRPGYSLASVLGTFAHEVEHYLGDLETSVDYTKYSSENDYVNKVLMESGGEFNAYQVGAKVDREIEYFLNENLHSQLLTFFDDRGDLVNDNGLKQYILRTLDYETKFRNNYREGIINSFNSKSNIYNDTLDWFNLYENNLNIYKSNIDIYNSNIGIYKNNINYYKHYNQTQKVKETEKALKKAVVDLKKAQDAVRFYQNIIEMKYSTLDEMDKELTELDYLIDKARSGLE